MKLSVVIVNYNVKYFLTQCLLSVEKARTEYRNIHGSDKIEVFVVDNNSRDNSCEYIKSKFPDIKLIRNEKNVGFSAANNQAIKKSKGEYVLLLNPDTLIPEDAFIKILKFVEKQKDAGAVGVKMTDGNGVFLPESKRAFPSPAVSFYKIFGLSKLFPESKRFGKYHLSFLDKNKTHKVDVLSGAFMLLRKSALDRAGLLDETFFMYGEDIDLSYRIAKNGFSNYYYPEVRIIHYKGESTKKGSLNYVFMFFNAMIIFAKKHFSGKNALLFSFLIKSAILFRAGLSVLKRIVKTFFLPVSDIFIFYSGFYFLKPLWENFKFHTVDRYPIEYMKYAVPSYIAVWLFAVMFSKGYQKPVDSKRLFKGILSGTIIILIIYSLLNEEYRYSRLLLIAGTVWAMIFAWLFRAVLTISKIKEFSFRNRKEFNCLILSEEYEISEIDKILKRNFDYVNTVFVGNKHTNSSLNNQKKYGLKPHLILSEKILTFNEIIDFIQDKQNSEFNVKIAYSDSKFIIGSHSVLISGELFATEKFNLNQKGIKVQKRFFDLMSSMFCILLSPLLILLVEKKTYFFNNIFSVLRGKYTWVGYIGTDNNSILPELKSGVFHPVLYTVFDSDEIEKINLRYARDYHLTDDFYTLYKTFYRIGNKKL